MDNKIELSSLASLYVEAKFNETNLAKATAFLINDKEENQYIITNRHVVTGRNNITNKIMDNMGGTPNNLVIRIPEYDIEKQVFKWNTYRISLYNSKGEKNWKEHPIYENKVDVVAIKLDKKILGIGYSIEESNYLCSICDEVKIIGYPFGYNVNQKQGYYGIWISGTIASEPLVNLQINGIDGEMPAFLVDARTRTGTSGSPVIYYNRQGILPENNGFSIKDDAIRIPIGIYSGRISKDSDLGIVWKWKVLKEIINQ